MGQRVGLQIISSAMPPPEGCIYSDRLVSPAGFPFKDRWGERGRGPVWRTIFTKQVVGIQYSVPLCLTLAGSIPRALRSFAYSILVRLLGLLTGETSVSQLRLENAVLRHQVRVLWGPEIRSDR